jgi:hypothetical protein
LTCLLMEKQCQRSPPWNALFNSENIGVPFSSAYFIVHEL